MIKPQLLKIKDEPNYVRDNNNNAIIANNLKAKEDFLNLQKKELQIKEMIQRITNLENALQSLIETSKKYINILDTNHIKSEGVK